VNGANGQTTGVTGVVTGAVAAKIVNLRTRGAPPRPALILGPAAETPADELELVFDLAQHLAALRPERFVRVALRTPAALELALKAILALGRPADDVAAAEASGAGGADKEKDRETETGETETTPVGGGQGSGGANGGGAGGDVTPLVTYLRRALPAPVALEIAALGRKLVEARGPNVDLARWSAAADLTAARAALVVTGDLETALSVVSSQPAAPSALPSKERMKDLIAFAISEHYFTCRHQLGIAVE